MNELKLFFPFLICFLLLSSVSEKENHLKVKSAEYTHALRNPLKGFTTPGIYNHRWATTAQTYIQWNELKNSESDEIEKIKKFCDEKWAGVEAKNIKIIPHVNWKYAFERQWLYYHQWGRLLYNPATSDAVFANAFNRRFFGNIGNQMVESYKLSTRPTLRIGQFFYFTWDHSLYIEGFIGKKRSFITLDEVMNSKPIEPNFISIKEYGDGSQNFGSKVTPLELASALDTDNQKALDIVNSISTTDEILRCEIEDVKAWAYWGFYFAKKIRTVVALNQNNKPEAERYISEAQNHWRDLVTVTDEHIQPSHLAITADYFHWKNFQDELDAEVEWVINQ